MNILTTFCCGFFGGAAPSLLELAGKAQAENLPGGGYYFALVIFGLMGGGVALVYKEAVTHKAFLLGVSAPALIVTAGTVVDQKNLAYFDFLPVSNAYAQEINIATGTDTLSNQWATALEQGKLVVVPIEPKTFGGKFVETNIQLNFQSESNSGVVPLYNATEFTTKYQIDLNFPENPNYRYAIVPNESTSASLSGIVTTFDQKGALDVWQIQTNEIPIPANESTVKFAFDKNPTFWGGFYDALGMDNLAKKQTEYPASIEPFTPKLGNQ